jgi:hypothetical protein
MFVGVAIFLGILSTVAAVLEIYALAIPAVVVAVTMLGVWAFQNANSA